MRFNCPHCHRVICDSVVMHYVMRHSDELERRCSRAQIQDMLDIHFGVKRQKNLYDYGQIAVDELLTAVELLARMVR